MKSTSQYHRFSASSIDPKTRWGPAWLSLLAVVCFLAYGGWIASVGAQEKEAPRSSMPAPPDDLRQALTAGNTEAALALLEGLDSAQPDSAALWSFYRGVALQGAQRWSEANAAFQAVSTNHPSSPWILQSTYRRAAIAQKTRDFKLAEGIYREAAARLLSPDRQAELAGIYNGLADLLAEPQDLTDPQSPKPRHAQALELYAKAFDLHATTEVRAHSAFSMGRSHQALSQHFKAAARFAEFLELVPEPSDLRHWEARLARAHSLGKAQSSSKQRRVLQDLIRDAKSQTEDMTVAVDLRSSIGWAMVQAMHRLGDSWLASGRTELALSTWEPIPIEYPDYLDTTAVQIEIATNSSGEEQLEAWGRVLQQPAPAKLSRSLQLTPEEDQKFLAKRERQMHWALYSKGIAQHKMGRFQDAIQTYSSYIQKHPNGADWSDAQGRILTAELARARQQRRDADYRGARETYLRYLSQYPLDDAVPRIQLVMGTTYIEEAAGESPTSEPDELFRKAIALWERCAISNGTSDVASKALYRIANAYEVHLLDAGAAVKAYRRVTFGASAGQAQTRLDDMLKTRLTLTTEHTTRSNEPVRIKVQTRNIENIEVHVHALDLESYFRKHHTHTRVEDLDLDLIAPAKRYEQSVKDFSPFTPMEFQLEVPVEGPGVWVVSVIGGEKRATTLVIKSDLDLVVKASSKDVFVYVQDMLKSAPASGVEVLLSVPSSDTERIVSVTTGEDGVARWQPTDGALRSQNLHAMALFEGHVASTAFSNTHLQVGKTLAPKTVIYTDRPAYRPGESMHWRAIALQADEGHWIPAGNTVAQVTLVGPGGRVYRKQTTALDENGVLHGTFLLPKEASPGRWHLNFSGKGLAKTNCVFDVESFRMPLAEVVVTVDKSLAWRGDLVTVTAQARTSYGAPLAHTQLTWRIPGHGLLDVRTNAEGRAVYPLQTREYGEAQILTVSASLPKESVHGSARIQLAVSGFKAAIQLDRDLELAGTSFPITVSTTTPDGSPTGQALTLQIKRTSNPKQGRWKEELLVEKEIQTDAATGKIRVPIEIAKGGPVVISVLGRDRFGQRISASTGLQISGSNDATKLRLLTRSSSVDLGQTGTLRAINRASGGLALMTLETDKVIEYRLVYLSEGSNELSFQTNEQHVPAVQVALAFMDGHHFYESSARFDVRPELHLEILPEGDTAQPGSSTRITLRATDGAGQPMQGVFSLAAVEEGLFQLYPGPNLDLAKYFSHAPREFPTISTRATCEFQYKGSTHDIAQGLLEEAKRVELEDKWNAEREGLVRALREPSMGSDDWMIGRAPQEEEIEEELDMNDMIGLGGGAGGKFGGRMGGRRNLAARGAATEENKAGPPEAPTAAWVANVETNSQGIGTLDVLWPERSTRWRLTAHGLAGANRFASATSHVTTHSDFFVELMAPDLLTEGDRPQMRIRIHDAAVLPGVAHVELQVLTLSGPTLLKADVPLGGSAIVEHTFPILAPLARPQELQATVVAVVQRGSKRIEAANSREIQVQAKGWQQVVSRSGLLADQIQLNMDLAATGRTLELHFGVTLEDDLIREALGRNAYPSTCRWNGGAVQQASNLIAACAVFSNLEGQTGHPAYSPLMDHIQGLVAALGSRQLSSGGWSWNGFNQIADAHSTAHVSLALSRAARLGWPADSSVLSRLNKQLAAFIRDSASTDLEVRAHLQHALASMGRGDFAALNMLFRARSEMSVGSRAHLALALVAAKRTPMAAEIVSNLEASAVATPSARHWNPSTQASWISSPIETTALVALAMQAVSRPAKESKSACDYLSSHRPWPNRRATGFAIWALAQQDLQRLPGQANGFVTVHVAGQAATRVALTSQAGHRHSTLNFELPDAKAGTRSTKVTIDLGLSGNILPQYTAILKGHVTEPGPKTNLPFRVRSRLFLATAARHDGKLMPSGFNSVVEEQRWRNERKELEAGEVVELQVRTTRIFRRNDLGEPRVDYLELQVPIPSGLQVLDSRRPGQRPYRLIGNSLVFPLGAMGQHRPNFEFKVNLVATHPGIYSVPRALLRSAYRPELLALSEPTELTLLPAGEVSSDTYRMTPDESFHLGQAFFNDEHFEQAREILTPLLNEFESKLRPTFLKDTARMLLFSSVDTGEAKDTIRYFEILKQRDPDLFIPIDKVLKIGAAYAQMGEHERAMLIFRATLHESFGKDLQIVGQLDGQGHWLMATRLLDQLVGEYPGLPIVIETDLTLADRVLDMAPKAHQRTDLTRVGAGRAALTGMGIQKLKRFLALYPKSPLSADAALNLVSAYFDLEEHATASTLCEEMSGLHKDPIYQDAFRYSGAVSNWYLGNEDRALESLLAISTARYPRPNRRPTYSPNRDLAKYIMAQIYHARRDVTPAIRYYKEIADQFPDAAQALGSIVDQELRINEEILRVHPGEPVDFTITHRNLESAELLVYPVDLMTLYLREKDLSRVTQVNLSGVSAKFRGTVQLPEGAVLRSQELKTSLPLTEPGAYLVILRGGSLHASSLVLVSDLELDVSEYTDGQVRVQVSSHAREAFLKDVDVRVLGSHDGQFKIGKTDPRGLFSARSVQGKATVIARMGNNHYAFHRGTQLLSVKRRRRQSQESFPNPDQAFFFSNVLDMNRSGVQSRGSKLTKEIRADRKGVQVQQVK